MVIHQFTEHEQAIYESMPQPLAIFQFIDKKVVTRALSKGFCDLYGYADREAAYHDMDHDMYKNAHPDDRARLANAAMRFATEGGTFECIYRNRKNDGGDEYNILHAMGEHVFTDDGARLAYVWYFDEGEYAASAASHGIELNQLLSNALHEESFLKAVHYDYLTGLPSMAYFFELAESTKKAIENDGGHPALLYLNLSGVKFYNAKHGFAQGDKLLQSFSRLLARTFDTENCCYIGGGHWAVATREEGLEGVLHRLFREWRETCGSESLAVKVGIFPVRLENDPVSMACDRAKIACDILKNTFDSSFNYYDKGLRDATVWRRHVLENFDRALDEGWIQVHYQPIVRAVNGRVCDEEALARWVDPKEGVLSPVNFVPFLEEAGLIYKLDLYMLDRVLEKLKVQQEAGLFLVPQSINLSRSDFDACDIVEEIRKRVDDSGLGRHLITVEVTESVIGKDFEFMKRQVERFHSLGFAVWMDDFGSGYSSLDVLQSIRFDLIKFDMGFTQRLDSNEKSKIILTELVKMVTSLGIDTVCEGVETESQARFLQEIGCSKLQGYYFTKPLPFDEVMQRYERGVQIGFEDPAESSYYEAIGRVNLYDFEAVAHGEGDDFKNLFNTFPMCIMELRGEAVRFVRTNDSYRDFMARYFGMDLLDDTAEYPALSEGAGSPFMKLVEECCEQGGHAFFDERMPDGSVVHSFARRIADNPVTGAIAVAIVVLSVTDADEAATYANIARVLATDYYMIYYVDLETKHFIEYSSSIGGEELSMERRGEHFFDDVRRDAERRVYEEDKDVFFAGFNRENVLREVEEHGVFTATYRVIDTGEPMYVHMKAMRMEPDRRHLIVGISVIDSQMKQREAFERIEKEEAAHARIMALSGDYLGLYTIDAESGDYLEFNASAEFERLGFAKGGVDFFVQGRIDADKIVFADDLPQFKSRFSKENVLREIGENGAFQLQYRIVMNGEQRPVVLKIVPVRERDGEKLIAGIRPWIERR